MGGGLTRRQLLVITGVATVAFNLALTLLDRRMQDAGGPSILGFEFVGSKARAAEILAEWGADGRHYARWSLWIDYAFMLSYGSFFTLASLATRDWARDRGLRRLAAVGAVAPFAAAAAPLFDACENTLLLLALGGHGGSLGPPLATACASLKFLLIGFAVVYVIAGLLVRARSAARSRSST